MAVWAVSIPFGAGSVRAVEIRQLLDALPGKEDLSWLVDIEDLTGGEFANEVAESNEPIVLDAAQIGRFADEVLQTYGGEFLGFEGDDPERLSDWWRGVREFQRSSARWALLDIRGGEWLAVTTSKADAETLKSKFEGARLEDGRSAFPDG